MTRRTLFAALIGAPAVVATPTSPTPKFEPYCPSNAEIERSFRLAAFASANALPPTRGVVYAVRTEA